jgi:aspartate kinase
VLSALLRSVCVSSIPVEATRLIITDECFYHASPISTLTHDCINEVLAPVLEEGVVPVVTGFIGATRRGEITTLGRGGSDFSAAIFARELDADELWIWKDVDGILTTDPKVLPEAQLIQEISFNETYELTYFGAKVLHPKTLLIVRDGGIPIRIMNTFNPHKCGTLISPRAGEGQPPSFKAVTGIEHVYVVSVEGVTDISPTTLSDIVFSTLADQGKEVLAAFETFKDHAIHFAVRELLTAEEKTVLKEAINRFTSNGCVPKVWTWNGKGIVSVIGHSEENQVQHVDRMLSNAGVDTGSYRSQGSSNSMQFLIPVHQVKKAIQSIHNEVILNAQ